MALKYSLHRIRHTPEGQKDGVWQEPGAVFEVADADVAFLTKTGAVRDPSEQELALYGLQHPAPAAESKPVEPKAPAGEVKAADTKAPAAPAKDPVG